MIRFQIVERSGAMLHAELLEAMRSERLKTFYLRKRGRRVLHTNPSYPGWMNWHQLDGVLHCEVFSPQKPGEEWKLLSAFIGRLADRYFDKIEAINIQFPQEEPPEPRRRRRKAHRRR